MNLKSTGCPMILSVFQNFSEFSEIFNVEHFKRVLRADVRIVSSLPSTHLMSRQSIENQIPYDVSPYWIRARFSRLVRAEYSSWCAIRSVNEKKKLPSPSLLY